MRGRESKERRTIDTSRLEDDDEVEGAEDAFCFEERLFFFPDEDVPRRSRRAAFSINLMAWLFREERSSLRSGTRGTSKTL